MAIELPPATLARLGQVQHELQRDPALAGLRWVRPDGIHLTLKFLGETPEDEQAAIERAISRAVTDIAPFEVELGKLGCFGSHRSPRVLWVDVEGDIASLGRLQVNVERELAALGYPPDGRAFSAHLTLARVPPERAAQVAAALEAAISAAVAPTGVIPVDEVALMRSDLRPNGAVYTQLFAAPLV